MDKLPTDVARTVKAFEQGWERIPKGPVSLSAADRSLAWDLLAKSRIGHRFDGAAGAGTLPLLLFRVADGQLARGTRRWLSAGAAADDASAFIAYPYGWPSAFGGLLTVTVALRFAGAGALKPRVCVAPDDPVFQPLQAGRFLAVFAAGNEILGSREIDLCADTACGDYFRGQWQSVHDHRPDLPDSMAAWWDVLDHLGIYGPHLSVTDKLSIGWVKRYNRETRIFMSMMADLHGAGPLPEADGLAPEIAPLYNAIRSAAGQPAPIIASIHQMQQSDPFAIMRILSSLHAIPDSAVGEEVGGREIASSAMLLRLMSSDMTNCGRQLPCLDADGVIRPIELHPEHFRESFPPEEYWPRKARSLHLHWRRYVTGSDTPVDSRLGAAELEQFPETDDPDQAEASADALLDEAVEDKKWTIPPGATVELAFGPFTHVNVFEHGADVGFVAQTADGDFAVFGIEPRQRFLVCDNLDNVPPERAIAMAAAIKLLLSAVIRDFWVIEHREGVFGHRRRVDQGSDRAPSKGEPAIVYLPRIQYTPKPRLDECAVQLAHQERRAHQVRAHLRRADRASSYQLILARKFNFDVPAGYTFVKPHQRGQGQRDVIYRSRSAIRSLYETAAGPDAETEPTAWFRFEREVRETLAGLGFQIQHVAASQRGDGSIDIYATRGDELHEENWVVHCKHCRGSRKVPSRAARDLAEALAGYPSGTRGMLMTDGKFSPGAASTAQENAIRLVDGDEMQRALGNSP
ncbi:MAG: hypothetical protein BIFFINMI_00922 [Phycisphaerae bacterium]|nr:hypothetical protein [Phycisphaerae bacterium]